MLSPEIIQFIIGQVGAAGIAVLALFLLDKAYKDALRREQETSGRLEQNQNTLIRVIEENAKVLTRLHVTIDHMLYGDSRRRPPGGET